MNAKQSAPKRELSVEMEVPGSPAEVWEAIATGRGITRWFTPSEVEERHAGAVTFHMAPGIDCGGIVTSWEPHRRFAYEEPDWMSGAPPLATEFVIQARSGGTCVVRLVTSLFASSDDWDDELDSINEGWQPMLQILRLSLAHYRGQPCEFVRVFGSSPFKQEGKAWSALLARLGWSSVRQGDRVALGANLPTLTGSIESLRASDVVLRVDTPFTGLALFAAHRSAGDVHIELTLRAYGERAAHLLEHEAAWRAWMARHFAANGQ